MKVLIIGSKQSSDPSGTVNTIKNIFSFLPHENILFISNSDMPDICESELNVSHYGLPALYKLRLKVLKLMHRGSISIKAPAKSYSIEKFSFKHLLIGLFDCLPIHIHKNQIQLMEDFHPSYIYTYGTNISNFKIAYRLSKKFSIPISIHIMDNWLDTVYIQSQMAFFRNCLLKNIHKCIARGNVHFTISIPLTGRAKQYFPNTNWTELMNPALVISEIKEESFSKSIKILYAGGITLNRWKSLLSIGKAIREAQLDIEFDIYIPSNNINSIEALKLKAEGIHIYPYVAPENVYDLYSRYDVLLLVESFEESMSSFLKFSLSTKVPEYLASGKCVLAYMPRSFYTTEFLSKNKLGCFFDNSTELIMFLKSYKGNTNKRRQLEYVRTNLSVEAVSKKITF
ncbi:glycosyltransferase family protein [Bacteroides sp.]